MHVALRLGRRPGARSGAQSSWTAGGSWSGHTRVGPGGGGAGGLGGEAAGSFAEPESNAYVVDFLSTSEGLQLTRAFAAIKDPKVRKKVLDLVEALIPAKD